MSTVIVGGIFAVAIIALILLVLAMMGETRAQENMALAQVPASTKNQASKSSGPAKGQQASAEESLQDRESRLPVQRGETSTQLSNGQFHELATELHTLHRQAEEIEHRLAVLVEIVERIERPQHGRVVVKEEHALQEETTAH